MIIRRIIKMMTINITMSINTIIITIMPYLQQLAYVAADLMQEWAWWWWWCMHIIVIIIIIIISIMHCETQRQTSERASKQLQQRRMHHAAGEHEELFDVGFDVSAAAQV